MYENKKFLPTKGTEEGVTKEFAKWHGRERVGIECDVVKEYFAKLIVLPLCHTYYP